MVLLKFIIFVFVCAAIVAFGDYQYIRYNQFIELCDSERSSDILLTGSICNDSRLKLRNECEDAVHRMRLTIEKCARSKLLHESELMRLWKIMTDSYFRILGFVLPVSIIFIYYIVGGFYEERKTNNFMKRQSEFIDKFYLNSAQPPPHRYQMLENGSRKKRKTYSARKMDRIEILDDEFDDIG